MVICILVYLLVTSECYDFKVKAYCPLILWYAFSTTHVYITISIFHHYTLKHSLLHNSLYNLNIHVARTHSIVQ